MTEFTFTTPREALRAMQDAGAVFSIQARADGLEAGFIYEMENGGDRATCRRILAAVKAKPAPFFRAFQEQVERLVEGAETPSRNRLPPTHEGGVSAPASTSLHQGDVSTSPTVKVTKREGNRA